MLKAVEGAATWLYGHINIAFSVSMLLSEQKEPYSPSRTRQQHNINPNYKMLNFLLTERHHVTDAIP